MGTWQFIRNFPPTWVADHGSANCPAANPAGTLGLQHDQVLAPGVDPKVLVDTSDATGRCHDPGGGGLEIVDVGGMADPGFEPREIHLVRLQGFSHTATGDPERPWLDYSSNSDFSGSSWIDVVDLRTCMAEADVPPAEKRERCRPQVFRIPFQPEWTRQRNWFDGQLQPGTEAACHDSTVRGGRLYCAGPNATLVLEVSGLTDASGRVRGRPLPCTLRSGTLTGPGDGLQRGRAGLPQRSGLAVPGDLQPPGPGLRPAAPRQHHVQQRPVRSRLRGGERPHRTCRHLLRRPRDRAGPRRTADRGRLLQPGDEDRGLPDGRGRAGHLRRGGGDRPPQRRHLGRPGLQGREELPRDPDLLLHGFRHQRASTSSAGPGRPAPVSGPSVSRAGRPRTTSSWSSWAASWRSRLSGFPWG